MTNQSVRRGTQSGPSRAAWNEAASAGHYQIYRQRVELLSAQYQAALLVGDPAADTYRQRGAALVKGFHGVED